MQSESAFRQFVTSYPYDVMEGDEMSLCSSTKEVCEDHKDESIFDSQEEYKTNMVSILMVVLCAVKAVTPFLNAGLLYQKLIAA